MSPGRFLPLQERRFKLEIFFCFFVWIVGFSIAGARSFIRLKIVHDPDPDELGRIASCLILVIEIISALGQIVSHAFVICMARLFLRYWTTESHSNCSSNVTAV